MLPATMVPVTPTISDTRAPKIKRLKTSRDWKSVPRSACALPPCIQNGGSKIFAPGIGSGGAEGGVESAKNNTKKEKRPEHRRRRKGLPPPPPAPTLWDPGELSGSDRYCRNTRLVEGGDH